jgi:hypothetical protein
VEPNPHITASYNAWGLLAVAADAKALLCKASDAALNDSEVASMPYAMYEVGGERMCREALGVGGGGQRSCRGLSTRFSPTAPNLYPTSILNQHPTPIPQLPDGTELNIGPDRFRVTESLFNVVRRGGGAPRRHLGASRCCRGRRRHCETACRARGAPPQHAGAFPMPPCPLRRGCLHSRGWRTTPWWPAARWRPGQVRERGCHGAAGCMRGREPLPSCTRTPALRRAALLLHPVRYAALRPAGAAKTSVLSCDKELQNEFWNSVVLTGGAAAGGLAFLSLSQGQRSASGSVHARSAGCGGSVKAAARSPLTPGRPLPPPPPRPPGGCSLIPNVRERLERELTVVSPPGLRVKVNAPVNPAEKRFANWIGAPLGLQPRPRRGGGEGGCGTARARALRPSTLVGRARLTQPLPPPPPPLLKPPPQQAAPSSRRCRRSRPSG